jgi:hypothetical protein
MPDLDLDAVRARLDKLAAARARRAEAVARETGSGIATSFVLERSDIEADLAALIAEVERLREALKLILGEFDVDKTDHYHGDPVVVIARDALADRID